MLSYFTSKAIIAYLLILLICSLIFNNNILPLNWIVFGIITVVLFFKYFHNLSVSWSKIPNRLFKLKLFRTSLIINVIWVLVSYLFFQSTNDNPFEFDAGDALSYHKIALRYSTLMYKDFSVIWRLFIVLPYSDSGFYFYLSLVYFLSFQSIIIPRLLNAVFAAYCSILIYKLASRNFGEQVGRIAAIFAILLPNLIYYTGLHLKETLMILILISFIERADYLIRSGKVSLVNIGVVVLLGLSLFLFRTVLGVSAFFAFFCAILFSGISKVKISNRMFIGFISVSIISILLSQKILIEVIDHWKDKATNQASTFKDQTNKFAVLGSFAVFAPIILITPLPTMVNIPTQQNQMMLNGAYFTRNVYAFFVMLALWSLFKQKKIKQNILIISFIFSYLAIIAASGFALSERFHLPVLPFLLILAAYGISQSTKSTKRYYIIYLLIIYLLIIGWNWFKLAGRGLE